MFKPGELVQEVVSGIVQPEGTVHRIGVVLPFDKKKAKTTFDSGTRIGTSCATSSLSIQYILVDFSKKLNPSLRYGIGVQFHELHHLKRYKKQTLKNKKRIKYPQT